MATDTADVALARAMRAALDPASINVFAKLKYRPHARQEIFHAATEDEVLYGGSRGGGKTRALVMEAIRLCVTRPGLRVLVVRRSFPQLRRTIVKELASVGFARVFNAKWNDSTMELRFTNGSLLACGYVDSLNDVAQFQGTEWGAILIDELSLLIPDALPILRETLRSGAGGANVVGVRATTNPGGASHTAVKTEFVDATERGAIVAVGEDGRTRRYVPATVYDNLQHVGKRYLAILEGIADPQRRKAMLEGDFDAFGGQVFAEWNARRHIVDHIEIPKSWRRWAGIDYGFAAPFACIWAAFDNDGRAWVYRERHAKNLSPDEQVRRIMEVERFAGEEVTHVIDPATDQRIHAAGPSIREMYAMAGLGTMPGNNDRLAGWQTVHSYLAEAPLCPLHALLRSRGEWRDETCPKLHVLQGAAPNLVRTLPSLPYDPTRVEDVDTKSDDHASDALRYLLHSTGSTARPVFFDARPAHLESGYSVPPPPSSTVQPSPFV